MLKYRCKVCRLIHNTSTEAINCCGNELWSAVHVADEQHMIFLNENDRGGGCITCGN